MTIDACSRRGPQRPSRPLERNGLPHLALPTTFWLTAKTAGSYILRYTTRSLSETRVTRVSAALPTKPGKTLNSCYYLSDRGLQAVCQGRLVLGLLLEDQSRQDACTQRNPTLACRQSNREQELESYANLESSKGVDLSQKLPGHIRQAEKRLAHQERRTSGRPAFAGPVNHGESATLAPPAISGGSRLSSTFSNTISVAISSSHVLISQATLPLSCTVFPST